MPVTFIENKISITQEEADRATLWAPRMIRDKLTALGLSWAEVVEVTRDTYHRGIRPATQGLVDGTAIFVEDTDTVFRFAFIDDHGAYIIV